MSITITAEGGSFVRYTDPHGNKLAAVNRDGSILMQSATFPDGTNQTTAAVTFSGSNNFGAGNNTAFMFTAGGSQIILGNGNTPGQGFDIFDSGGTDILAPGDNTILVTATAGFQIQPGSFLTVPSAPPATAGSTGVAGAVTWDATHIYVCIATDSWVRAALAAW